MTFVPGTPNMIMGHPEWWHHHGSKMRVETLDVEKRILKISGSAASVSIKRASEVFDQNVTGWLLQYEVVHSCFAKIIGTIWLSGQDLESAFGLSSESGKFGDWIIIQFGAETAEQGHYVRWEKFLNIPGPGTGHDGDPNVSIEISEEIKKAIRQIL